MKFSRVSVSANTPNGPYAVLWEGGNTFTFAKNLGPETVYILDYNDASPSFNINEAFELGVGESIEYSSSDDTQVLAVTASGTSTVNVINI